MESSLVGNINDNDSLLPASLHDLDKLKKLYVSNAQSFSIESHEKLLGVDKLSNKDKPSKVRSKSIQNYKNLDMSNIK